MLHLCEPSITAPAGWMDYLEINILKTEDVIHNITDLRFCFASVLQNIMQVM